MDAKLDVILATLRTNEQKSDNRFTQFELRLSKLEKQVVPKENRPPAGTNQGQTQQGGGTPQGAQTGFVTPAAKPPVAPSPIVKALGPGWEVRTPSTTPSTGKTTGTGKSSDKEGPDAMMDGMTPVSGLAAEQWDIPLRKHADLELG